MDMKTEDTETPNLLSSFSEWVFLRIDVDLFSSALQLGRAKFLFIGQVTSDSPRKSGPLHHGLFLIRSVAFIPLLKSLLDLILLVLIAIGQDLYSPEFLQLYLRQMV